MAVYTQRVQRSICSNKLIKGVKKIIIFFAGPKHHPERFKVLEKEKDWGLLFTFFDVKKAPKAMSKAMFELSDQNINMEGGSQDANS